MADIFISYASEDRERAGRLASVLESCGWSVWWDRKIVTGQAFDEVIERELEAATCVIVLWSRDSIGSEWVKNEAAVAAERGVLVPALIDRVKLPLEFRRRQTADLVGWDGNTGHEGLQALCNGVAAKVAPSKDVAPCRPAGRQSPGPRRRFPRAWAAAAVIAVALGVGLYWGLIAADRKPTAMDAKSASDPADLVAGMEFVLIPAGSFTMGSTNGRESEKPPHEVNISHSLYLQTTEVRQGQWKRVMGDNPSSFKECGDDCPVENVSWDDVKDFIKKLNVMEKTDKYRLPTEAEWEYACRAGKTTEFSFGGDGGNLGEYAWYEGNSEEATHKVAAKKPNPWGLYDMHGNIWEWMEDDWHYRYDGSPSGGQAWIDKPRDSLRVIRGGSWESNEFDCRSAARYGEKPGNRSFSLGFRLAKSVALGP